MDFSFIEMLTVGLIAFLVLGPKELVRWSEKAGAWVRKFRMEADRFKAMAKQELLEDEQLKTLEGNLETLKRNIEILKREAEEKAKLGLADPLDIENLETQGHVDIYNEEIHGQRPAESVELVSSSSIQGDPRGQEDRRGNDDSSGGSHGSGSV